MEFAIFHLKMNLSKLPNGLGIFINCCLLFFVQIVNCKNLDSANDVNSQAKNDTRQVNCPSSNPSDCLSSSLLSSLSSDCPLINQRIFNSHFPRGMQDAGEYEMMDSISGVDNCVKSCCDDLTCHFSFITNGTCFRLSCTKGSYFCTPVAGNASHGSNFLMVSVRPPFSSNYGLTCEVGADEELCGSPLTCKSANNKSRNGACVCPTSDKDDISCLPKLTDSPSSTPAPVEIAVSVGSKNVTLPENEVTLLAYAVPQASPEHPYSYLWQLLSNPQDDTAAVEGKTTDTLHLTGLKVGLYVFSVTVSNGRSNGSANASVLVLPQKKPNQAPIAIISPPDQTVHLPTNSCVLDASLSTDDDKIISYNWELQKGPIQYTFNPSKSFNSSTLQVENLIAGNYTFKLTVEDSEHITNSTTANVTVIKAPDYPPVANPGQDIVVHLPKSEVVLNGNQSTDDKKIVGWEWKAKGEQANAIDMQDTHTPYLKLSHLQLGYYQFELKVTDEAGQSATGTVHVIVKEPTGTPPKANAGVDQTIVLNQQTWAVLDGSESKSEDSKIVHYTWKQIRGPTNTTIRFVDSGTKANVTGLTKGEYEFLLEVEDEAQLKANSTVKISVVQRVNEAPKAKAGGVKSVRLPLSFVELDGSSSTDDVKIVKWQWIRQPDSAAAGDILNGTDQTPVLKLINLVPGKYIFKLVVTDEQGLSDGDIATLNVGKEPNLDKLIEVIIGVSDKEFTESNKLKIIQQLDLLLRDIRLVLERIRFLPHSGNVVFQFHGINLMNNSVNATELAAQLRDRVNQDVALLEFPIYSVDTVLCLDTCSGHGTCNDGPKGRECVCNPFWMANVFTSHYERNCEWSKVYVGVVLCLLMMFIFALIWILTATLKKTFGNEKYQSSSSPVRNGKRHYSSKKEYTLINDQESEIRLQEYDDEVDTDDDSDSDILFESSSKRRKNKCDNISLTPLSKNGVRNGILKQTRSIKA